MSYTRTSRLARWAEADGGRLTRRRAVWAVGQLARDLAGPYPAAAAAALVLVCARGGEPAVARALRVLRVLRETEKFAEVAYQSLLQTGADERVWSSVTAPLLLAPAPATRHRPHVRLVQLLDREPDQAERVVDQLMMCVSFSAPRWADAVELLSATDHPLILDALAARWRERTLPTALATEVVVANPHITPRETGDTLLAVAKDRPDLLDHDRADTADALVNGVRLPGLADKYRHALRTLRPGRARDQVCVLAQRLRTVGQPEARAAAIDAGYLPEGEREQAVFLYLTEQWDHYDAADPDGDLLYEAWAAATGLGLRQEISNLARRTGRPDPFKRWRAAHPRPEPSSESPRPRIGGVSGAWGGYGGGVHT